MAPSVAHLLQLAQGRRLVNIEHALPIPGWMGPEELEWLAQSAFVSHRIAEVGAWQGRSTVAMADNTLGIVFAVDTWKGSPEHEGELRQHGPEWLIEQFLHNIAGRKVCPVQMISVEAAELFSSQGGLFDFIFLDASHDYDSVKADIAAWYPLLKHGGIFAGHDYTEHWPGVTQAVREAFPDRHVIAPNTAIWMVAQ